MIEKLKEIHKQMMEANEKIVEIIKNSDISKEKKDELIEEYILIKKNSLITKASDKYHDALVKAERPIMQMVKKPFETEYKIIKTDRKK